MALLQNAKNRIVARGAGIVCMVASNRDVMFIVDDGEVFNRVKDSMWSVSNSGYMAASIRGEYVLLHRMLKEGDYVDHINNNKLDNRINNLRAATNASNNQNRPKQSNNKSGYKGVSFYTRGRKWQAVIHYTVNGVRTRLHKLFNTALEAARQYDIWA